MLEFPVHCERVLALGVIAVALVSSCNPERAIGPTTISRHQVQPDCIAGCMNTDPAPDSDGVFITGDMYTWYGCVGDDIADSDGDGLRDSCEYTLAHSFTPMMSFEYGDDINREPRWAAHPGDNMTVSILYMLSYWDDGGDTGNSSIWCGGILPFIHPAGCRGHAGDSEWIELTVQYNEATQHWVLLAADLSIHGGRRLYYARSSPQPTDEYGWGFAYPDHNRSFPLIWVADGKHSEPASI